MVFLLTLVLQVKTTEKDTTFTRRERSQNLILQCFQLLRSPEGSLILCLEERYYQLTKANLKSLVDYWFWRVFKILNPLTITGFFVFNLWQPISVTDQEIVEMILFPVVNEACRVLEDGVVVRASDLDVASVLGMSFPSYRLVLYCEFSIHLLPFMDKSNIYSLLACDN